MVGSARRLGIQIASWAMLGASVWMDTPADSALSLRTYVFGQNESTAGGTADVRRERVGGKHARAAVGMGSLPRNIAVEIELIVEVE